MDLRGESGKMFSSLYVCAFTGCDYGHWSQNNYVTKVFIFSLEFLVFSLRIDINSMFVISYTIVHLKAGSTSTYNVPEPKKKV